VICDNARGIKNRMPTVKSMGKELFSNKLIIVVVLYD
jgi:hypothetical protein